MLKTQGITWGVSASWDCACPQPHPLLAPKAPEDRAPAAPHSVLGGMGSQRTGWPEAGVGGGPAVPKAAAPAPGRGAPRSPAPHGPPSSCPSPSTVPAHQRLCPADQDLACSPLGSAPGRQRMPTEPRALCPGDRRPGSGTVTWAWSLETVRVAPWTLLVAGGPPGLWEARPGVWLAQTCPRRPSQRLKGWAGTPSQTPFTATRHSGPVLLPPEPCLPASLIPDGPRSVVQVVVGVPLAQVPPPAPAQEKAHPAASTANARLRGPA